MAKALRPYLQMAAGLVELTAERAREVAKGLADGTHGPVPTGAPAVAGAVAAVAADLLSAANANRGLLLDVVRGEAEKVVAGLGLVTPTDVVALRKRVTQLEREVATLRSASITAQAPGSGPRTTAASSTTAHAPTRTGEDAGPVTSPPTPARSTEKRPAKRAVKQAAKPATKQPGTGRPAGIANSAARRASNGDTYTVDTTQGQDPAPTPLEVAAAAGAVPMAAPVPKPAGPATTEATAGTAGPSDRTDSAEAAARVSTPNTVGRGRTTRTSTSGRTRSSGTSTGKRAAKRPSRVRSTEPGPSESTAGPSESTAGE